MAKIQRVLIFNDGFSAEDLAGITLPGIEFTCIPRGSRAQLLELIPDFDAYLATLRLRVDQEVLDRAPRLRLVATGSTGTDHFDLDLMRQRGITVFSIKDDRDLLNQLTSTAELAFGLLLTCARHLPLGFAASREGRWEREKLAGCQLRDKTLGIVGMGRLGTMMARYGKAFWMRVIAWNRSPRELPPGVEKADLFGLLRQSDFVSLHVHLSPEKPCLFGAAELGSMKPGSVLINTSRGQLIDETALIREMEGGRIAAAGLDVIDGEWREDLHDHPLIAYSRRNPRLYISPHVGGTSPEGVQRVVRHTFRKMVDFLASGRPPGAPEHD